MLSEAVTVTACGRGERCQAECGFLWQLAAMVTVCYRNVSQHVSLAIKQNKQTEKTRREGEKGTERKSKASKQRGGSVNVEKLMQYNKRTEYNGNYLPYILFENNTHI